MAAAVDSNGKTIQALCPIAGTLQRLTPVVGAAARTTTPFKARSCLVGVCVRVGGIAHSRLGDAAVAADATDLPLTVDNGWFFMSRAGKDDDGNLKTMTHLSVFAETANVQIDVVEFE